MATITSMANIIAMDADGAESLLYLLQVTNSSFPTGAFNHSYGFETLIDSGELGTAAALESACRDWLHYGVMRGDAAVVAHAHRAAQNGDTEALVALDRMAGAIKLSREGREASAKTGGALANALRDVFDPSGRDGYGLAVADGSCEGHFAVVFGKAASDFRVPEDRALLAYLHSSLANVVSVAARLIPLGQVEAQRIVRRAWPMLSQAAEIARATESDMIGTMMVRLEIASMRHERMHSRLCMS